MENESKTRINVLFWSALFKAGMLLLKKSKAI